MPHISQEDRERRNYSCLSRWLVIISLFLTTLGQACLALDRLLTPRKMRIANEQEISITDPCLPVNNHVCNRNQIVKNDTHNLDHEKEKGNLGVQ